MIGLLMLINSARLNVNVAPLASSTPLTVIAQSRAEYLCSHSFSHQYWQLWMQFTPGFVGENLGEGYASVGDLNEGFIKSPEHYANMIDPKYHRVGIGEACGITVETFAQ